MILTDLPYILSFANVHERHKAGEWAKLAAFVKFIGTEISEKFHILHNQTIAPKIS